MEEVAARADLKLRGSGYDDEMKCHTRCSDDLIGMGVSSVKGFHVHIRRGDGGVHVV